MSSETEIFICRVADFPLPSASLLQVCLRLAMLILAYSRMLLSSLDDIRAQPISLSGSFTVSEMCVWDMTFLEDLELFCGGCFAPVDDMARRIRRCAPISPLFGSSRVEGWKWLRISFRKKGCKHSSSTIRDGED